jgi:hypothetical protein
VGLAATRSRVFRDVNKLLTDFCLSAARVMVRFAEAARRVIMEDDSRQRAWCGLWTYWQVDLLRPSVGAMSFTEKGKARKLLKALGRVTQKGVLDIWDERTRVLKDEGRNEDGDLELVNDPIDGMRSIMMRWIRRGSDGTDYG